MSITALGAARGNLITLATEILACPEILAQLSAPDFRIGVENKKGKGPLELLFYGIIGDRYEGMDARSVATLLATQKTRDVIVRINSPGGLAFDGLTIHNALTRHEGRVVTSIEGLAASAGSLVAVAGDEAQMMRNAVFMMHRSSGIAMGNTKVMNEMAKFLGKIDAGIAETYAAKSGQPLDEIYTMLDGKDGDGTFYTAVEAKEIGFVDTVVKVRDADDDGVPPPEPDKDDEPPDDDTTDQAGAYVVPDAAPPEVAALGSCEAIIMPLGSPDVAAIAKATETACHVIETDGGEVCYVQTVVPANPPGGGGEAVAGRWRAPSLGDFTDTKWPSVTAADRAAIAKHFGWYTSLEKYDGLALPHHFPPNHRSKGKASQTGVKAAIARVAKMDDLSTASRGRIRAHLRDHLPEEDALLGDIELLDRCRAVERDWLSDRVRETEARLLTAAGEFVAQHAQ